MNKRCALSDIKSYLMPVKDQNQKNPAEHQYRNRKWIREIRQRAQKQILENMRILYIVDDI